MNHIYRLIWNQNLNAWVVTSELTKTHGKRSSSKSKHLLLAFGGLLYGCNAFALDPGALPSGGQITGGAGHISQSNNQMTIRQDTSRMTANWDSFNIGQNARVQFQQPSTSSVALNRVIGQNASDIQGKLDANGHVYLVNPNGVVFGKTAQVNVGGFIASTKNISDADFNAGKAKFSGDSQAKIDNQGRINAKDGVVALIANQVDNTGSITAQKGDVVLAAGKKVELDFDGDGLIKLEVDGSDVQAQINNQGLIQADGAAIMTAKVANQLVDSVVNNQGIVKAQAIQHKQGRIILDSGNTGSTNNDGQLIANNTKGKGGDVTVLGKDIQLTQHSQIEAKGTTGGGNVLVGGDWQGSGTLHQATTVTMHQDAKIDASATQKGDGGKVVLWSDVHDSQSSTQVHGSIQAKSAGNGKGGRIETSGHYLDVDNSQVNAGQGGQWLLDPYNVTITNGGSDTNGGTVTSGAGGTWAPSASGSTISNATINAALDNGQNVSITTSNGAGGEFGNININGAINKSSGGNASLSLLADGNISVSNSISSSSGALATTLTATNGWISGAGAINTNGGLLTLSNTSSSGVLSGLISGSGGLVKNGIGPLTLSGDNTFTGNLTVNAGTLLGNHVNAGTTAGSFGVGSSVRTFTVNNGGTLSFGASNMLGNHINTSPTNVTLVINAGGTVNNDGSPFNALGPVQLNGGTLTATGGISSIYPSWGLKGDVTVTADSTLSASGTNAGFSLGAGTVTGTSIDVASGKTLTVSGPIWNGVNSSGSVQASSLTKTGAGTLSTTAANTYTGATNVNAGTLKITATQKSQNVAIASGAIYEINATSNLSFIDASAADAVTYTGAGIIKKTGAGLLMWGRGVATFAMGSGSLIDVEAGTFQANSWTNDVWTNNKSDLYVASGAIFATDSSAVVNAINGSGNVSVGYSGGTGTLTMGSDNGGGTLSGVISSLYSGSGGAGIIKTGTGTQILTGNNTYNGTTLVGGGILQVGNSGSTGTLGSGAVTDNANLVFKRSDAVSLSTLASDAAGITGAGSLTADMGNTLTIDRAININGAISLSTSAGNISQSAALTSAGGNIGISSAGTLAISSSINTGGGMLTASGAAGTTLSGASINVGAGSGSIIGGTVSGSGISLSGANTSSGTVTLTGLASGVGHGVNFAANATLANSSGNLRVVGNTDVLESHASGRYGVYLNGGNTVTNSGTGTLSFEGTATGTGNGLYFNQGTYNFSNSSTGSISLTGGNTYTTDNSYGYYGIATKTSGTTGITINTSGTVSLTGTVANGYGAGVQFYTTNLTSNGATTVTGTGVGVARGVQLEMGDSFTVNGGSLALSGISTSNAAATTDAGLQIRNTATFNRNSGTLSLSGTSPSYRGVDIFSSASLVFNGDTSISGTSTSGSGIYVGSASFTDNTGNVALTGSSSSSYGISFNNQATISNTGAGSLSLSGTSDTGTGLGFLAGATAVTLAAGNLNLIGNSTSGTGLSFAASSNFTNSGSGSLLCTSNHHALVAGNISSTGPVSLLTIGDLTIASTGAINGNNPVLSATGAFINNRGSDALTANSGRWLVYSNSPNMDTFGNLDSSNYALWHSTYSSLAPASVSDAGNRYLFAYQPTLTVTTLDASKTYGDDASSQIAASYIISGLDAGASNAYLADDAARVYSGTPAISSAGSASTSTVGSYAITASAGSLTTLAAYAITYSNPGNLLVNGKSLNITANDTSKTYGDSLGFNGTEFSVSGLVNGDSISQISLSSAGTSPTAGVGSYDITGSAAVGSGLGNYTINYVPGDLAVNTKALNITANSASKTYGDALSFDGTEFTSNGLVNGDSVSSVSLNSVGANPAASIGSYAITGSAALGSGLGNYIISYVQGELVVNTRALNITANSASKTYGDGLSFDGSEFTSNGLVNGDYISTINLASAGANALANVGSYAITGSQANGSGLANYHINYNDGLLAISPKLLNVGNLSASNKVYDGTVTVTMVDWGSLNGLVSGQTLTLNHGNASFSDKNAGISKQITVSGYSLSDGSSLASNYQLISTQATTTADISKAGLSVAGIKVANKVYDGSVAASLNGGVINPLNNDSVDLLGDGAIAHFVDKHAGVNKPVIVVGFAISGADAGNYQLLQPTNLTADISKADLQVIQVTASNKVYDGNTVAVLSGGTVTALASDIVGVDSRAARGDFVNPMPGVGKAVVVSGYAIKGADAGNYTVLQPVGVSATIYDASVINNTISSTIVPQANANAEKSVMVVEAAAKPIELAMQNQQLIVVDGNDGFSNTQHSSPDPATPVQINWSDVGLALTLPNPTPGAQQANTVPVYVQDKHALSYQGHYALTDDGANLSIHSIQQQSGGSVDNLVNPSQTSTEQMLLADGRSVELTVALSKDRVLWLQASASSAKTDPQYLVLLGLEIAKRNFHLSLGEIAALVIKPVKP